jgi:hypothetical protein
MKLITKRTPNGITYILGKHEIPTVVKGEAVVKFPNGTIRTISYKPVKVLNIIKLVASIEIYGLSLDIPLENLDIISIKPNPVIDKKKY